MTRVSGHGLQHEGRPVLVLGCCADMQHMHQQRNRYDQLGHGLCQCGQTSPCETTTAARQRWHREHKEELQRV